MKYAMRGAAATKTGPNNASGIVWAHFCRRCPSCHVFHRLPLCIYYKCQLASKKMKKEKKSSLMAQRMPDVLFGPVFVAATPPIMYFVDYIYIYTKR